MMKNAMAMTENAQRGHVLSMMFASYMKRAFRDYAVEVTLPEPSTGNGVRALQSICLVSKSDGRLIVVGRVNLAEGWAELRTLGHMLALSQQRFGREFVVAPIAYIQFLTLARAILEEVGVHVTVVAYDRAEVEASACEDEAEEPRSRSGLFARVRSAARFLRRAP